MERDLIGELLVKGELKSRTKVFPLAFSVSICFGVATVALVVACSGRVRSSLADRVHLHLELA